MADLITASEAGLLLGCSGRTVERLAVAGELPSVTLGRGGKRGRRYYSRLEVERFISRRLKASTPSSPRLPTAKDAATMAKIIHLENEVRRLSEAGKSLVDWIIIERRKTGSAFTPEASDAMDVFTHPPHP